jgi:hypothetical protein
MNTKGQGALEYLLLIGGAVVVAAIVVIILLQLGGTSGNTATAAAMSTTAAQLAALARSTPDCTDLVKDPNVDSAYMWNNKDKTCWVSSGNYPNCTATKTSATSPTSCCAALTGCSTTGASNARYTEV